MSFMYFCGSMGNTHEETNVHWDTVEEKIWDKDYDEVISFLGLELKQMAF